MYTDFQKDKRSCILLLSVLLIWQYAQMILHEIFIMHGYFVPYIYFFDSFCSELKKVIILLILDVLNSPYQN